MGGVCYPGRGEEFHDMLSCTDDLCDPATGLAYHPPINVDDGDPCTIDGCSEIGGVWHMPDPACAPDGGAGGGDLDAGCPPGPAPPLPDCGLP